MSDPTQFIVNLSVLHRLMQHEGIVGTGRDLLSGTKCVLHSYTDRLLRTYVMQTFDSVDADFISCKMNALAHSTHSGFVPNIVRPCLLATRKSSKALYQLAVFYDTTQLGDLSLEKLIAAKKMHNQKFQTQEITAFFWQMADLMMMGAKNGLEYLQITPINIFCKIEGLHGYNFFLTNFGKQYHKNKTGQYTNPEDQFHKGVKNIETARSAAMFTLGMVLLQMACLLPTDELYENGVINRKVLDKRIQGIKITNDRMIASAIKLFLQSDEIKRIKAADVFQNQEWLKLRKVIYYPSKHDFFNYKNFEGVAEYDGKTSIGQALDSNLCMIRGTFISGIFEGRGVREVKDTLEIGVFVKGELVEGQIVKKNKYTEIGKFKAGYLVQGMKLELNISTNRQSKQQRREGGYMGSFEQGQLKKGSVIYHDGSEQAFV